jgi:hypothetical protein
VTNTSFYPIPMQRASRGSEDAITEGIRRMLREAEPSERVKVEGPYLVDDVEWSKGKAAAASQRPACRYPRCFTSR